MTDLSRLALSYLKQAEARFRDARRAYRGSNPPYALRLSQESVELCVKAALRSVGIEYPKQHEVSYVLLETRNRFPEWFRAEIPFIQEASQSLSRKREIAFYGGEDPALMPEDAINREDAKKALDYCARVLFSCEKLLGKRKVKQTRSP